MNDSIDFNLECFGFIVILMLKLIEGLCRKLNWCLWFEKFLGIKYSIVVENYEKYVVKSRKSDMEMEILVFIYFINFFKIGFGICKVGDLKYWILFVKNFYEYV